MTNITFKLTVHDVEMKDAQIKEAEDLIRHILKTDKVRVDQFSVDHLFEMPQSNRIEIRGKALIELPTEYSKTPDKIAAGH